MKRMKSNKKTKLTKLGSGLIIVLLLFISTGNAVDAAEEPFYSYRTDHIFWVAFTADTHIGANFSSAYDNLAWFLTEFLPEVNPHLTVFGGDLTDGHAIVKTEGDEKFFCYQGYDEWDDYNTLVTAVLNSDNCLDVPGNHDSDGDDDMSFYLERSIQGQTSGQTQNSVYLELPFGTYHFLGTDTAEGGSDCALGARGLDAGELGFIEQELQAASGASMSMVFGHHPIGNFSYGAPEFRGLLTAYGASLYGYGHTHSSSQNWNSGGYLELETASLGKTPENDCVSIIAVDCNGISVKQSRMDSWPIVMITAPLDRDMGGVSANPQAYHIGAFNNNPIRVLAFDTTDVSVSIKVNMGSWQPLTPVPDTPHLFYGAWDSLSLMQGLHTITARAVGSGEAFDTITVYVNPALLPTPEPATPTPQPVPLLSPAGISLVVVFFSLFILFSLLKKSKIT